MNLTTKTNITWLLFSFFFFFVFLLLSFHSILSKIFNINGKFNWNCCFSFFFFSVCRFEIEHWANYWARFNSVKWLQFVLSTFIFPFLTLGFVYSWGCLEWNCVGILFQCIFFFFLHNSITAVNIYSHKCIQSTFFSFVCGVVNGSTIRINWLRV